MANHLVYKDRAWERQPEAELLYRELLEDLLRRCPPAKDFATRLRAGTAVRLRDIVDHIQLKDSARLAQLAEAGWVLGNDGAWRNSAGIFPAILPGEQDKVWLRVESIDHFRSAIQVEDQPITGKPHGPMRKCVAFTSPETVFGAVERNGFPGFEVEPVAESLIRSARIHFQSFRARRRQFDTVEQGLSHTETLVDQAVSEIGAHWACDLWLKAEREYWMGRCPSGRFQKSRQDAFGIGWSNIDHHTYDGSRQHFRHTIRIFEKLGYELREMLYAGELAGWGSQVLEQPVIGSTIFADVDLAPEELTLDFSHEELEPLSKHRRAGLLSALLGESILEAGLNHVAGLYDQKEFRAQLQAHGLALMKPFTDWPHLYQELTEGDWGAVDPARVAMLEADGHIDAAEAERLRVEGSIVAHLENIERNEGFKGFNREGIDNVLRKLDPRAYLKKGR